MRSPGLLNFLYLRWFLRRLGLPALRAAQGFHGFFGWIARVRRSRRAFEDAISAGDASLVFLGRRTEKDPFAALVRMQRDLFQPIFLVPVLLVWSRRAQKLKPSFWDVLYGSPEAPSAFANAIAFLRSFRRAVFDVGRPVDLQARLRERPRRARRDRGAQGPRRPVPAPRARVPHRGGAAAQGALPRAREGAARSHAPRRDLGRRRRHAGVRAAALAAEAERDLKEIASRFDPAFVGVMRGLLAWMFGRLYRSVEVDEEGLARVKRAAAGAPIVLCPSHKSHIDYLVLSFLLYEHGMTPPHVAAGINLSFWPFGAIARRGGAFFIRRKVKGDRIYTAVLRAYVKHLLRDRFPQEFYIEGGRSRTGKLLPPKTGLVSMEVDAWLDGAADDVVFVPVAIDYEKLIEASSYVRELSGGREAEGEPARPPRRGDRALPPVRAALRAVRGADLAPPGRLRAARGRRRRPHRGRRVGRRGRAAAAALAPVARGPAGSRSASADAKRALVQAVTNRIAYAISRAVTITPVGLVAATLLSHGRRGHDRGRGGAAASSSSAGWRPRVARGSGAISRRRRRTRASRA